MPGESFNSSGKPNGSILASTFVLLTGAIGLLFVIAVTGGDPYTSIISGVITFVGLCLLVFLIRATSSLSPKNVYNWVFSKQARPEAEYQPRRAREASRSYGDNRPPNAEELRDMKDGLRNWVPSNVPKRSKTTRRNRPEE
ncbi:hypothetical protein AB1L42_11715 [Thalassoglobus sp. JC818]|uniref:hypothetical protein n=1 Tax=Thalassoglobus sp. JC818 TaxID=3232136 RepID=UPI00345978B4